MGQKVYKIRDNEKITKGGFMIVERLKAIRCRLGLSQKKMIEKLNVSKSTYSRWETGEKIIPLKHLVNFCNEMHISIDYLLGISNDKKEKNKKALELNLEKIGLNIYELRKKHNLTQKELAEKLNTTQSTISSYENGKTILLTAFLCDICTQFKISALEILK